MGTQPISNGTVGIAAELSGTGSVVKTGGGVLQKLFISTASNTPTVAIYDGATAGATSVPLIPQFTPVAGTTYQFDVAFQLGLNIVIGGTVTGAAMYL